MDTSSWCHLLSKAANCLQHPSFFLCVACYPTAAHGGFPTDGAPSPLLRSPHIATSWRPSFLCSRPAHNLLDGASQFTFSSPAHAMAALPSSPSALLWPLPLATSPIGSPPVFLYAALATSFLCNLAPPVACSRPAPLSQLTALQPRPPSVLKTPAPLMATGYSHARGRPSSAAPIMLTQVAQPPPAPLMQPSICLSFPIQMA
ncbi:hypothetical protein GOP47_0026012, partial [Adiantum capillus-veneris]